METKAKQAKKRGIVLITTMLLLTIIIMIATLMTMSAHQGMKLGSSYSNGEQAYYAALSGLEYARAKLYESQDWQEASPHSNWNTSKTWTDSSAFIREENGVVTGYFGGTDDNSCDSKFVIAFDRDNAQDMKYISCNNFSGNDDRYTYKAGASAGSYDVDKSVEPRMIRIVSKGVSGNTVRYAEALIKAHADIAIEAASMSMSEINVKLKGDLGIFNITNAEGVSAKTAVRAIKNINVDTDYPNPYLPFKLDSDGIAHAGKVNVRYSNGNNYEEIDNALFRYGISVNYDSTKQTNDFLESIAKEVTWENVSKVIGEEKLASGAYLYIENQGWSFFDSSNIQSIDEKNGNIKFKANNSTPLDLYNAIKFDASPNPNQSNFLIPNVTISKPITCTGPLYIGHVSALRNEGDGYLAKLHLINRVAVNFDDNVTGELPVLKVEKSSNPIFNYKDPLSGNDKTYDGNIYIQGELKGSGKIVSENSVYFQGGSFFDTRKNNSSEESGVSIYADQDVKILKSNTTDNLVSVLDVITTDNGQAENGIFWDKFVEHINPPWGTKEKSYSSHKEVAQELLNFRGGILDLTLRDNGITNKQERLLYAQSLIAANGAIMGGEENIGAGNSQNAVDSSVDFRDVKTVDGLYKLAFKTMQSSGGALGNSDYMIIGFEAEFSEQNSNKDYNDFSIIVEMTPNGDAFLKAYRDNNINWNSLTIPSNQPLLQTDISTITKEGNCWNFNMSLTDFLDVFCREVITNNQENIFQQTRVTSGRFDTIISSILSDHSSLTKSNFYIKYNGSNDYTGYVDITDVGEPVSSEKPYLQLANKFSGLSGVNNTVVRGMIFTRNGGVYADMAGDSLTVRGGLIAYGGDIDINNASSVNFCYDPDYMKFFSINGARSEYAYIFTFGN